MGWSAGSPPASSKPPMYPVINSAPSAVAVFRNLKFSEWGYVMIWSGVGFCWGFCGGRPLRRYNSIYVTGLGFSMAMLFQLKASCERLQGFKENEGECARVGVEFAKVACA